MFTHALLQTQIKYTVVDWETDTSQAWFVKCNLHNQLASLLYLAINSTQQLNAFFLAHVARGSWQQLCCFLEQTAV